MRVEEEAFEVTGCSTAPNTYAPKRARQAREAGSAGLFHGYRFCLLVSFMRVLCSTSWMVGANRLFLSLKTGSEVSEGPMLKCGVS